MYKFLYFIALSFIICCASPSKQLEVIDDADSKELTFIIELNTKGNSKEKVEEFTQYLAAFIKEREPSSIYGYFISEDGSRVTLIERYNNSEDGIQHGKTVFYFETGKKRIEQNYKEGKAHGKVFWYHQNGQIGWEETYNEGIPEGKWIYYSNDGSVGAEKEFKEGKEVSYFSKGEKIRAD